jgi:phenylacetate-CoA ligase
MRLGAELVRWVTYPLHELGCGRHTLREMRFLRELLRRPAAAVAADADRRLTQLLRFSAQNMPFYAARFAQAGVCTHAANPLAELAKLAPLTKTDIRAGHGEMVCDDVPGGAIPHSSGGTTGDTLHFHIDHIRQAQTLAARLCMQERLGVRLGERRAYLWGSPIERRGRGVRALRDRLLNELLLDAFELSPESLDAHLAQLRRFGPALLYAYPSAAETLARRVLRSKRPSGIDTLRLVVLTGEEVTAEQRYIVQAAFKCPVVQEYGSREVGLIAHECARGGLHVISPHIHVETLVHGVPAAAGRTGDIVCTTLNTRAQPFIRYRLGDAGALLPGPCSCGLPLPLLRLDGGKVTGFVALRDGRLCHGAITSHILRDEPGIVHFKTVQRSLDRFEVLLVTDPSFRKTSIERIRRRYREQFGEAVTVECALVSDIPPDPSGKRRYFVSEIAPARFDTDSAIETGG